MFRKPNASYSSMWMVEILNENVLDAWLFKALNSWNSQYKSNESCQTGWVGNRGVTILYQWHHTPLFRRHRLPITWIYKSFKWTKHVERLYDLFSKLHCRIAKIIVPRKCITYFKVLAHFISGVYFLRYTINVMKWRRFTSLRCYSNVSLDYRYVYFKLPIIWLTEYCCIHFGLLLSNIMCSWRQSEHINNQFSFWWTSQQVLNNNLMYTLEQCISMSSELHFLWLYCLYNYTNKRASHAACSWVSVCVYWL